MASLAYKNTRAAIQVLSLVIIVINLLMIAYSYYYYYLIDIENDAAPSFMVTYYTTGIYILCFNLLFGLFASCGGTSGYKFLMSIFMRAVIVYLMIIGGLSLYFSCFYINIYGGQVGEAAGRDYVFSKRLTGRTGLLMQDRALIFVKDDMGHIINLFVMVQIVSIVFFLVQLGLIMYAKSIKLTSEPEPRHVPRIVELSRRGLNTASLKMRNVVEVVPQRA